VETQTGYVLALHMNLLDEPLRRMAGQRLADRIAANDGRLGTGCPRNSLPPCRAHGYRTYRRCISLAAKHEIPFVGLSCGSRSYDHVGNAGTATRCAADPSMNSYNHYAYGAWWQTGSTATPRESIRCPMIRAFTRFVLQPNFDVVSAVWMSRTNRCTERFAPHGQSQRLG